ncbi:MAG: XdhC family protein [Oscillospiraceae bacterium]
MKTLFGAVVQSLHSGHPLILVSVVASSGSTPRGAGAMMLVFENGSSMGTIGGGAVEHSAQKYALGLFAGRTSQMQGYCLAPGDVANLGMICGGNVTVYFQYLDPADTAAAALFEAALAALNGNQDVWLVRRLEGERVASMGLWGNNGPLFAGNISDDAVVRPLLQSNAVLQKGELGWYVEPIARAGRVYIFGGGHVTQALVPVLAKIEFAPVVVEELAQFAAPALFPGACEVFLMPFDEIGTRLEISSADYGVIMTRGHQSDYTVLRQIIMTDATYIGCIGSRHKIAATRQRLVEEGISAEAFARVHTPIGLEIGAETPAEIAISIAGEMIAHRAGNKTAN